MKNYCHVSVIIASLITIGLHMHAQFHYTTDKRRSTMTVRGTSNVHDWEMEVRDFTCSVMLFQEPETLQIQTVRFGAKAGSIRNQSSIMNKKTHDALMTDRYPDITFQVSATEILRMNSDSFKGSLTGALRLAGETGRIIVPVSGEILSDAEIEVSGSVKLRMSNFGIRPPTAILGTLKTGDEVTVDFHMVLKREQVTHSP